MHLVMFDIDGTLTETMKVDEECFVRSFMDVFGFSDIDTDWSHYRHTTDSGILRTFTLHAPVGHRLLKTNRDFGGTSSSCSQPLPHGVRSPP
jgi:beta-phosphoglucomutase-like phosphatase (HAD superfamily)